ncbi:MAG: DUF1836 domain-containing protein [Clostridia bacterium]|nr:DUF1836 domain-containing protein [Clostridia bacterium]
MVRDIEYRKEMMEAIVSFRLPRYHEIPGVGLYLEQTAKYINEYLAPLGYPALTGSMISNYVKKGLVSSPVKKQYCREQIAKLMFISVAKSVIRIEDLGVLLSLYEGRYETQVAYDYFCMELENVLQLVFGLKDQLAQVGESNSELKMMLRTGIIAVAHKVYLDQCFDVLRKERG